MPARFCLRCSPHDRRFPTARRPRRADRMVRPLHLDHRRGSVPRRQRVAGGRGCRQHGGPPHRPLILPPAGGRPRRPALLWPFPPPPPPPSAPAPPLPPPPPPP